MGHDPDVLVVGGGVAGLCCAYYLRQAGADVVVAERGTVADPLSSSYGNTGFVGTQGAAPQAQPGLTGDGPFRVTRPDDEDVRAWLSHFRRACHEDAAAHGFRLLLELKRHSFALLRELCAAGDLAATFGSAGIVLAFHTEAGFAKARESVPHLEAHGVPMRVLSPAELRELEPDLDFDVHGALYNPDGGFVQPPGFVHALARTLDAMGVPILTGAEVTGFDTADGAVTRVHTTRGDMRPREVVVAAGVWTAGTVRPLGIELALQPVKGYSVTVPAARVPRLPILLSEGHVAVAPLGDRLRFAGVLELSGMDRGVELERAGELLRTARAYLPGLQLGTTAEVWAGLRPCTPDSLPYLGRAFPYRNLYIACGHGHIGMGLAPACGRLLAQLITGGEADMDLAPLRTDRHTRAAA